nr:MFS transporter [Sansalvadorimonas sp. 2012CJ34-2]
MTAVGGFLEFYDFIIYALMAGYLAEHFFPETHAQTALLATFSTFASGYLARPIGGVLYGHFGDKTGRKKTFSSTILVMAIATGLIGILPGHDSIGVLAPVLLVILRLFQGLALGGEIPGAVTYISESVPERQGLVIGVVFMALIAGAVFGSLVHVFLGVVFSEQSLKDWGWRLAFLFGGLVGVLGYHVRRNFHESKAFKDLLNNKQQEDVPAKTLIKKYPLEVFQGVVFILPAAVVMPLVFLFFPSWLVKVMDFDPDLVRWSNLGGLALAALCSIYWGSFTDGHSNRTTGWFLGLSLLICGFPLMSLTFAGGYLYVIGTILFGVLLGMTAGFGPVQLTRLFPVSVRYSGVALSYNLAFAIVGGLVPVVAMGLMGLAGNLYGSASLPVLAGLTVLMVMITFRFGKEPLNSLSAHRS